MADQSDHIPALALLFKYSVRESKGNKEALGKEYTLLLKTCRDGGLVAAGKCTRIPGTLLIFVDCLEPRRRHAIETWDQAISYMSSDQTGLHAYDQSIVEQSALLRALYTYVTVPRDQGGLGIAPASQTYPHLDSIFPLHSRQFRLIWLQRLKQPLRFGYTDAELIEMGSKYGESTALYFGFLTSYARALILPALIGICLHFKSPAFVQSPVISILLIGWAVIFIERWKSTSNRLSATISASTSSGIRASITHSADGVAEARVAENVPMNPRTTVQTPWWVVEARASLSIPFVLASALFVYFNMTVAFFLEAFIAKLYDGPFSFLAPLVPTIYNAVTTPPFVAICTALAHKITAWEGHSTQRSNDRSLLLKILPVHSIVAFYALILSAFVYIPFGEELMTFFHMMLFETRSSASSTGGRTRIDTIKSWRLAVNDVPRTTPRTRLADQMFSFTLILQVFPLLMEILLPFVVRFINTKLATPTSGAAGDARNRNAVAKGAEDEALISTVLTEASLPGHRLYNDYMTLALQFGYGVMWSTTWPLTPAVLLFLALIRLRTDALKILMHYRRTIPSRGASDSARIWVDALSFLTWGAVLSNVFLLVILEPLVRTLSITGTDDMGGIARAHHFDVPLLVNRLKADPYSVFTVSSMVEVSPLRARATTATPSEGHGFSPLGSVITILLASYVFFGARWYIKHILQSAGMPGTARGPTTSVANDFLSRPTSTGLPQGKSENETGPSQAFWGEDEGESEIWKKVI